MIEKKVLTVEQMLEEVIDAIAILEDNDDRILENQAEILEKLENLSLPGGDYSVHSIDE